MPHFLRHSVVTFVVSRTVSEIRRLIGRKTPIRTHSTLIQRPRSEVIPFEFWDELDISRTRMMGLPYGEEIMIVGRTMWTQSTSVRDRQTDGRTDGRTELLSQRQCNAERRTVIIINHFCCYSYEERCPVHTSEHMTFERCYRVWLARLPGSLGQLNLSSLRVGKLIPAYSLGLRRGAFTCVGWQVALCVPI